MADVATPSAIAMSTGTTVVDTPQESAKTGSAKPEKPDEAAFKAAEAKKRKELEAAQAKTKELEAKFTASKPSNKDSPSAQRRNELKAELAEIRAKQQANKSSRTNIQDRVNALETQLKAKIQESKTARARLPFKSVEEVDQRIAGLTKDVDSGKMKIVDEKKALNEITNLNKSKKDLALADGKQKEIDAIKQSISETKKEFENPEVKALSAEYDRKQAELDSLKAEQDAGYKNRDANKDAFFAAKTKQSQIYQELKKFQDEYYKGKRAFSEWERESKKQYFAKKKAENEARDLERKKRVMEEELEAAKTPAYADHIYACDSLIRILDPASAHESKLSATISQFAATAQRVVDDSGIKGTKLTKKNDDEDYFVGTGGKKGKKGKKGVAAEKDAATSKSDLGRFHHPGVAQHFEKIGVSAPATTEDEPKVLQQVKDKKQYYLDNQDQKTKENVAAVQKKFDRLEAANGEANGNGTADKTNGTTEITDKLANSSVTDSTTAVDADAVSKAS